MKIITIGRHENNDIRIDNDSVSRLHAKLELHDDGQIYLQDDSSNGTIVRGQKIHKQKIPVTIGDDIRFGNVQQLQWSLVTQLIKEEKLQEKSSSLSVPWRKLGLGLAAIMVISTALAFAFQYIYSARAKSVAGDLPSLS